MGTFQWFYPVGASLEFTGQESRVHLVSTQDPCQNCRQWDNRPLEAGFWCFLVWHCWLSISRFVANPSDQHGFFRHVGIPLVSRIVFHRQLKLIEWLQLVEYIPLSWLVIVSPVGQFQFDLLFSCPSCQGSLWNVCSPCQKHRVFLSRDYWSYLTLKVRFEVTPLWRSHLQLKFSVPYSHRIGLKLLFSDISHLDFAVCIFFGHCLWPIGGAERPFQIGKFNVEATILLFEFGNSKFSSPTTSC